MARIRYLKHDFFLDEELAVLPFETRLTFQGLWILADRRGRLEDRPMKIKAMIFPYDTVKIEKCLEQLTIKPFIHRYEAEGRKYIQILNFEKHQKPHHTERESTIPPFNGELTVKQPLEHREKKEGMGIGMGKGMGKGSVHHKGCALFNRLWEKYPSKVGRHRAEEHFKATVTTPQDEKDIEIALNNYLSSKRVARGYVQNGSTWFNSWRDWIVPPEPKSQEEVDDEIRRSIC